MVFFFIYVAYPKYLGIKVLVVVISNKHTFYREPAFALSLSSDTSNPSPPQPSDLGPPDPADSDTATSFFSQKFKNLKKIYNFYKLPASQHTHDVVYI